MIQMSDPVAFVDLDDEDSQKLKEVSEKTYSFLTKTEVHMVHAQRHQN